MQRRVFLRSGAMALVTIGLSPSFLRRAIYAQPLPGAKKGKVLVCLFQRGAADGLNILVPHGAKEYYALRPTIAIPREQVIDLDGFFGLHPSLAPLQPLWKSGMLAPVTAVGSPSNTRSHFDAQDYMETGTPDVKGTADGWLNRVLAAEGTCAQCQVKTSPFRAVAFSAQTPRSLEGPSPTIAMSSLDDFTIRATGDDAARLEALYRTGNADIIHGTGAETFDAVKMLRDAQPQQYLAEHGAEYPRTPFGQNLKQIAQLIKAEVGLEIAFADIGGWDTHVNQGAATGQLATRLNEFATAIAAFSQDLGDRMGDVLILTMSEFGRMAKQNGNGGTDHGHAGALFVIGGEVKGGKVHGKFPGLDHDQLFEGRDLALTTDFRAVFAEVTTKHLGVRDTSHVFPGFVGGNVGLV